MDLDLKMYFLSNMVIFNLLCLFIGGFLSQLHHRFYWSFKGRKGGGCHFSTSSFVIFSKVVVLKIFLFNPTLVLPSLRSWLRLPVILNFVGVEEGTSHDPYLAWVCLLACALCTHHVHLAQQNFLRVWQVWLVNDIAYRFPSVPLAFILCPTLHAWFRLPRILQLCQGSTKLFIL